MNVVFVIFGLLALIGGAVAALVTHRKSWWAATLIGMMLFVFGFSFEIVPTGYTGVRTTFGQISDEIVPQGFNLKIPFAQNIKLVNNKQQDTVIKSQIWGESFEKTPVYASEVTVTYQIASKRSAWIFANVTNTDSLISQDIVASAIKSAMVELTADEVTVRSRIEPEVKEKLIASIDEKYGADTIEILKVTINQMDFEDSYNAAIAAKSVAQQEQAKQKIENDTAIAKAEADKKVAITNAEATAEALRIAAQAEADANRLLEESLTDRVLKNRFYEKWDGALPKVMGESSVLMDITDEIN